MLPFVDRASMYFALFVYYFLRMQPFIIFLIAALAYAGRDFTRCFHAGMWSRRVMSASKSVVWYSRQNFSLLGCIVVLRTMQGLNRVASSSVDVRISNNSALILSNNSSPFVLLIHTSEIPRSSLYSVPKMPLPQKSPSVMSAPDAKFLNRHAVHDGRVYRSAINPRWKGFSAPCWRISIPLSNCAERVALPALDLVTETERCHLGRCFCFQRVDVVAENCRARNSVAYHLQTI